MQKSTVKLSKSNFEDLRNSQNYETDQESELENVVGISKRTNQNFGWTECKNAVSKPNAITSLPAPKYGNSVTSRSQPNSTTSSPKGANSKISYVEAKRTDHQSRRHSSVDTDWSSTNQNGVIIDDYDDSLTSTGESMIPLTSNGYKANTREENKIDKQNNQSESGGCLIQ